MTALTSPRELPGEAFTRRAITIILALITGLTFAFGSAIQVPWTITGTSQARPASLQPAAILA